MLSTTLLQRLCLFSLASVMVIAAPTSPDTAKRSFTSGRTTCYWTCPAIIFSGHDTLSLSSSSSNSWYGTCSYGYWPKSTTCQYSTTTGEGIFSNSGSCPSAITTYTCGSKPSNSFKRDLQELGKAKEIKSKVLSAAQQKIAERQFKFKRSTTTPEQRAAVHRAATMKRRRVLAGASPATVD